MYKWLRAGCAVAAAACCAACIPVAIVLHENLVWFWLCLAGTLVLFALSMLFKYLQEEAEGRTRGEDAPAAGGADEGGRATDGAPAADGEDESEDEESGTDGETDG